MIVQDKLKTILEKKRKEADEWFWQATKTFRAQKLVEQQKSQVKERLDHVVAAFCKNRVESEKVSR